MERHGDRASTSRSCIPAARRRILVGATPAGWIGEIHPQVASQWDWSEPVAAFEIDLDAVAEHVPLRPLPRSHELPEVREDLAVIVADTVSAAEVLAVVREAGGALLAGAEVFDVYRDPERIGAGNVSLALALRFRAPDRTLTDEEVASRRHRSPPPWHSSWRGGSVTPSVAVFGAAGYAGALSARLLHRHPRFQLVAVTARSDVGRRLDEVYPHHRVPLVLEELDLDRHADVDAAIVAYPARGGGRAGRRAASARRTGGRPERRLPPA